MAADRIAALDLIRGVAVLGILAVNVAGFAGPPAATLTPHLPNPGSNADEAVYAAVFVLFEGKMRGLFSLLFGTGIALFIERAEAAGRDGERLQLRRLGWLMLFGLLHYFLFWWGDILFLYAVAGLGTLLLHRLGARELLAGALVIFATCHIAGAVSTWPGVGAEEGVRTWTASPEAARAHAALIGNYVNEAHGDLAAMHEGFAAQVARRLREEPLAPLDGIVPSIGETLPLMLLGIVLYRRGFFDGDLSQRKFLLILLGGALGLAMTLAALNWLWARHFPVRAMSAALLYGMAPAHLLMTLAYAATLVRWAPRLARRAPGRALVAAGRMAFSNYLGTTVLMTAIFSGWGLARAGAYGQAWLPVFVVLGWGAMLAASSIWLNHFRRGPLEWLWRSLTERRIVRFR